MRGPAAAPAAAAAVAAAAYSSKLEPQSGVAEVKAEQQLQARIIMSKHRLGPEVWGLGTEVWVLGPEVWRLESGDWAEVRGHWWTEWAPAWGYTPATGAGEGDTLQWCLNILRIV